MTTAGIAFGLPRERADASPHRVAAGRAEWLPLGMVGAMHQDWQALSRRALEPNVFYDPAFALAAAPVFGNPGTVLVWSKAGRLIGFFPCRIERRYGMMTALTGWTHPYAPFGVPLVDRDEAEAAIAAFLDHVEANEKLPKLVMLPLVATDGAFTAAFARVLLRHGGAMQRFGTHARALLAPTAERRTYLDHALSHKKLKDLRRQRRRLQDKGLLKLTSACEADDIPRALSDYLALEADGWKGRAGSAATQHAAIRAFMQGALGALAAEGHARIDSLMQNGRPLAAAITLRSGTSAWFWKIAYNENFARCSPGVQVSLDVTELLLADPAIAHADSCATAGHPMIDHLWRERLALSDLLIAPSAEALTQLHVARHLETLRRTLISAAKFVRDYSRR